MEELGWFSSVGAGWEHPGLIPHRLALEDALAREEQAGAVWGWGGISGAPSSCVRRERRREMEFRNYRVRGLFSPGRALTGVDPLPGHREILMCILGSNCSREREKDAVMKTFHHRLGPLTCFARLKQLSGSARAGSQPRQDQQGPAPVTATCPGTDTRAGLKVTGDSRSRGSVPPAPRETRPDPQNRGQSTAGCCRQGGAVLLCASFLEMLEESLGSFQLLPRRELFLPSLR